MQICVWCNTSHSILDVVNTGGGLNRGCESEIAPVKYLWGPYLLTHHAIFPKEITLKEVRHNPQSQK